MNQMKTLPKEKLWTADFVGTLIVSFLISTTMIMQGSTISMFVDHIGGSKSMVGVVTSVFTISALLFRPMVGRLIDSKSRKIILIIGIVILASVSLFYAFAYSIVLLLVLRFIHGIGLSAQSTAVGTIISDVVPSKKLAEGVGYNGVAATMATAIGPALGIYIIQKYNFTVFYAVTFVFAAAALISIFLINYEKKQNFVIKAIKVKEKENFFEKTAIPASVVMFFIMITTASVFAYLPAYAMSKGINNIGMFFSMYAAAFLISRTAAGRLYKNLGISKVMIGGIILLAVSFVVLAYADSLPAFLAVGLLYGFAYSSTQPNLNSIAVSGCEPERRGAANATFFSSMDIGYSAGALLWGFVSQAIGFTPVYLLSAVFIILSFAVYMIILYKKLDEELNKSKNEILHRQTKEITLQNQAK